MSPNPESPPQMPWVPIALQWIVPVAALLLAAAAFALALRTQLAGTGKMTAPELAIVDQNGALRARLTSQGLTLIDADGRLRARITTGISGSPDLALFSHDGKLRAVLGLGSDDTPAFTLHDKIGRVRARLSIAADDRPAIVLYDDRGLQIGSPLPTTNDGNPSAPASGARPSAQPSPKSAHQRSH